MGITDTVKDWLWSIAIKKGVVSAAKLLVAFALAHGIKLVVVVQGVTIDLQNEAIMIVAINSGLTVLRNFLKTKYPKWFGWM
mgnify:CR=1 FL=1